MWNELSVVLPIYIKACISQKQVYKFAENPVSMNPYRVHQDCLTHEAENVIRAHFGHYRTLPADG